MNTRIVVRCSVELNVCQDARSLRAESFPATKSYRAKRSQTCKSLASSNRFQLIACTCSTSLPVEAVLPCHGQLLLAGAYALWASSPAVGPWAFRSVLLVIDLSFHGVHQHQLSDFGYHILLWPLEPIKRNSDHWQIRLR